jgi:hypothetical protein
MPEQWDRLHELISEEKVESLIVVLIKKARPAKGKFLGRVYPDIYI